MSDPDRLDPLIAAGADHLDAALGRDLPVLADRARAWLGRLVPSGRPADYFRHPRRFPVLQLPWWAVADRAPPPAVLADVTRSSMAGYWYIRLVDDAVDRDPNFTPELLPLTAFLHHEFEYPYHRHFPVDSPFWPVFRTRWLGLVDATTGPAGASVAALLDRAEATIGAVVIPLRALTLAAGADDRFGPWAAALGALARLEQLIDDLTDWTVDLERGAANLLLAEGRGRVGSDELPGWVVREGLRWALGLGHRLVDQADPLVAALESRSLTAFLDGRRRVLTDFDRDHGPGLAALNTLARVFPGPLA